MIHRLAQVFSDSNSQVRGKLFGIYAVLIAINVGAWLWALAAFHAHPVLLGTALLAYSFGLRHAVDADHIAAIDNATRKLMQEQKRPVAVGLFFSLGHSSVVVLASIGVAFTAATLKDHFEAFKAVGGVIGTSVSALFLLVIALMNLVILRSIYKAWRHVRQGGAYVEEDFNLLLADRGFMARIFRPLFRLISRSWHLYPLGFLFGLGFDTATEIGLLGISATSASHGISLWSIMVFPVLFAVGMALIDSLDNFVMIGAYGWAFSKPVRKLYYNITITAASVVVALFIGGVEALGLIAEKLQLTGGIWTPINAISENFGEIGYWIIGMFVLCWLISALNYYIRGYDQLPANA